jgi:hypothetical protein
MFNEVVVHVGTNNVMHYDVSDICDAYRDLIAHLRERVAHVSFVSVPPFITPNIKYRDAIRKMNDYLRIHSPNFIDLMPLFFHPTGELYCGAFKDRFHFSPLFFVSYCEALFMGAGLPHLNILARASVPCVTPLMSIVFEPHHPYVAPVAPWAGPQIPLVHVPPFPFDEYPFLTQNRHVLRHPLRGT